MLEVEDVHTYYGDSHVLNGVSLRVEQGKCTVLLGRNGMGKTTLIRTVMGLTPPRRGVVRLAGREITGLPPYEIARLGVGLVPQGRRIFPSLTVRENLTVAARNGGQGGGWTLELAYRQFPRLRERAGNLGGRLSGGEQQMLAIARAMMTNPRLLLMDEPSEGLSPLVVQEIGNMIRGLRESGLSILLVEQNLGLALELADHIYVLSKGRVVMSADRLELEENPGAVAGFLAV